MERLVNSKTRMHLLWLDIKLFISKVKQAYYEVKTFRLERRIKELTAILAIKELKK